MRRFNNPYIAEPVEQAALKDGVVLRDGKLQRVYDQEGGILVGGILRPKPSTD